MRTRLNVYFPPALAKQVDELANRRRFFRQDDPALGGAAPDAQGATP